MSLSLNAIGIVVGEIDRSLDFYRLLGVPVPDGSHGEDHVEAVLPNGLRLMWDTRELIQKIDPHWQEPVGHRMGLCFECAAPEEVDSVFAQIAANGYTGKMAPFDAFWGQRYAQVVDPDGNVVDLFASLG